MVIARPQPEQLGKFGDTGEFPEALVPAPEVGYQERLNRSTLLPAFSETVKNMMGRVFVRAVTLGDEVPENIREWVSDEI